MNQHSSQFGAVNTSSPTAKVDLSTVSLYEKDSLTHEQLEDLVDLMAKRFFSEANTSAVDYSNRLTGKCNEILFTYLLTDMIIDYTPGRYELEPAMNLYNIAPEWIKDKLTPLLATWKAKIYKDPDFEEATSK